MKLESSGFFEGNTEEKEIIINKNTDEELSILVKPLSNGNLILEIKRGAQKKNYREKIELP